MNGKLSVESSLKAVCSVSELARAVGLSRGRFYQLVEKGSFPSPLYDIRTQRPYYTQELQQICHEVRRSNIGHDGLPILFYAPRKKSDPSLSISSPAKKSKSSSINPIFTELTETLSNMGIRNANPEQVKIAFRKLYPEGNIENMDHGMLIRQLFRHFKTQV